MRWILCVLFASSFANADVIQHSTRYDYYAVHQKAGRSLLAALNEVTPISEDEKKFHGKAKWNVKWNIKWSFSPERCELTQVKVDVFSTILLPKIIADDVSVNDYFVTFLNSLRIHEIGHVRNGINAAYEIESVVQKIPPKQNCDALTAATQRVVSTVIKKYELLDIRYDKETGHGKTQGAWIDPALF